MDGELLIRTRFYQSIGGRKHNYDREQGVPPNSLHVTSLVYDCDRRGYYYNKANPDVFNDIESNIRMWVGRAVHDIPLLEQHEVRLNWEGITGQLDEYEAGVLLEKKHTASKYLPRKPYDHHVKQAEYYSVLCRKNDMPVAEGYIMYIKVGKPPAYNVFPVTFRPALEIESEMLEKRNTINKFLEANELPPKTPGWYCTYCKFLTLCYNEEDITPESIFRRIPAGTES